MKLSHRLLAAVVGLRSAAALTPAQWRSQSIYQLLTDRFARADGSTTAACNLNNYCGGSWRGVIDKLDYIQGMGFTAIWISPVVENLPQDTGDGEAYHGYWAQNVYELNSNFGSAADLKALSTALHKRGMYLMVDVVTNHLGYAGCGECVDYSVFNPFNSQSYFHPYCPIDYNNQTSVEVCWEGDNTVALADLRTEYSNVSKMWNIWIAQLVSNYSIDGLRIDSCAEVDQPFFKPFVSAAGVYAVGEVDNGDPTYVCPYQEYIPGVLNYPAYYWITQAFESTSGSISNLVNGIRTMRSDCADTTLLGSFMENHDNPRFPSMTADISLAKNAIAYTMLADGIPIIYYGQEQHFSGGSVPNDREALWLSGYPTSAALYQHIAQLNRIRRQAISVSSSYVTWKAIVGYYDSSTIVIRKGNAGSQIVGVFSNRGANGASYILTLARLTTGFLPKQAVVEVLTCVAYSTDSKGRLAVTMANGLPRVFFPRAQLGKTVCRGGIKTASSTRLMSSTTTATSTTFVSNTTPTIATTSTSSTPSSSAPAASSTPSTSSSAAVSTTPSSSSPAAASTTPSSSSPAAASTTPSSSSSPAAASTTPTSSPSAAASTTASATSPAGCTVTSDAVTFNLEEQTSYGENVYITGNITALGTWSTSNGVPLSASQYTATNPLWYVTINFAPGTAFQYKYYKIEQDGSANYEGGSNRVYSVACASSATENDTWQS